MRTIYFGGPDTLDHILYLFANWFLVMLLVLSNMIREQAYKTLDTRP